MTYTTKAIETFIKKRFPSDCNWLDGNCYYFAVILKTRFPGGQIYYDVVDGHFIFKYCNKYYDWSGEVQCDSPIAWDIFNKYDYWQEKRIIKDCIE